MHVLILNYGVFAQPTSLSSRFRTCINRVTPVHCVEPRRRGELVGECASAVQRHQAGRPAGMFPAEISEDPFVEIPHPDATARGDLEVLDSVAENQLLLELPTAIVESAVVLDVNFRPPMRPNAGQEKTVQKGLNKVNVVLLFPRKEVNDAIACASVIRKHAIRLRSIRASLGEHGPARL